MEKNVHAPKVYKTKSGINMLVSRASLSTQKLAIFLFFFPSDLRYPHIQLANVQYIIHRTFIIFSK